MTEAWSRVLVAGPLAPYVRAFAEKLVGQGYAEFTVAEHVRLTAHLSRWLASQSLEVSDLTPFRVDEFLQLRRDVGYTDRISRRAVKPLLGHLGQMRLMPPSAPSMPTDSAEVRLLERYRRYLLDERGLVESTVHDYHRRARLFLSEHSGGSGLHLEDLTAAEVRQFVLRECHRRSVGSAQCLTKALRSLLRFLFVDGWTTAELASTVPSVASWRLSGLPRALAPDVVVRLLGGCNRATPTGRRDYAVLVLLARLGLRAGEVAALELGDFDWRRGEVLINGKGRRQEVLPLPVDVGEAVSDYLEHGRAHGGCRRVFLRARAPVGGVTVSVIEGIVRLACERVGLLTVGPHRLRHTAATEMLRGGATLSEIGQVLRHRSLATTAIYAKVDRAALRNLAQPWPGGRP
jgi:integrase/recombinase XerD